MTCTTELMIELNLIFDNDYNVYQISNIIDLLPVQCQNRNETRINPITNQQNPGYWSFSTGYIETLDFEMVSMSFINKLRPFLPKIQQILYENGGEASICVVLKIKNGRTPILGINKELMEVALQLKCDIDFDLYVN